VTSTVQAGFANMAASEVRVRVALNYLGGRKREGKKTYRRSDNWNSLDDWEACSMMLLTSAPINKVRAAM